MSERARVVFIKNRSNPLYTFPPGSGLLQGEDIFYDYALMAPINECGPFKDEIVEVEDWPISLATVRRLEGRTRPVALSRSALLALEGRPVSDSA